MVSKPNADNRRTFSPEFKQALVKQVLTKQQSVSVLARQHDINANQLFRWRYEWENDTQRWVKLAKSKSNELPVSLEADKFLPVQVVKPLREIDTDMATLSLHLANGHRLTVEQATPKLLETLLVSLL